MRKQQGDRLKQVRIELGLKQKDFALQLGITPTALSEIENGRNNISQSVMRKLLNLYGLDANWLVNGEGPMLISDPVPQPKEESPVYALLPIIEASGEALVKVRAIYAHYVKTISALTGKSETEVNGELSKELEVQKALITAEIKK